MDILDYLNEKFSESNFKDLNIGFQHYNELGHDNQILYSVKYNKKLYISNFYSKFENLKKQELIQTLNNLEELKFDKEMGCLISKNVLEFRLEEIVKSYNSGLASLLGFSSSNFSEITFNSSEYSIKLTKKTINNGIGIIKIPEYKFYLENILKNNISGDAFCQNVGIFFHVTLNNTSEDIFNYFSTHISKKKLLKEINSCLLTLASKGLCLNLLKNYFEQIANTGYSTPQIKTNTLPIPYYSFEEEAVAFYKLAKSSTYPSQKFLHYYHVLEFFFLKTSENELHKIIESKIASPNFLNRENAISEIINSVKKFDLKSDEEEKLRLVLKSSTENENLLNFIENSQTQIKQKYSKSKKIFGKDISIRFEHDHIIGNIAKVIKHLRNALVHSSDLYNREECYVPFSSCEDIYAEFTDLMDYLALNVLSANAKKI